MVYVRVQTNRMLIKKLIEEFSVEILKGEMLIAPRPLPKRVFKYYYAIARVEAESPNYFLMHRIKNCSILSEAEFEEERNSIQYCWSVE
jgi:hypothetical protein